MEKYAKDIKKGDKIKINRNGIGWGFVTQVKKTYFIFITCEDGETMYYRPDEKIIVV